jgi:DNA-binding NtrC family response regulator
MAQRGADILCIGLDSAAMRTRLLILERAGHKVTQARDLRQVESACEAISFDVAILGQSLNANEKMRVSDVLQKNCKSAKILELHIGVAPDLPHADEHLQATAMEPQDLIGAVNALL